MVATGETVGLAEWIIDDTCLVYLYISQFNIFVDPGAEKYPDWHIPLYIFGWTFGAINPIIYMILNKNYRDAYMDILFKIWDFGHINRAEQIF